LFTKNIKDIYANDRLAYTEITMDIACAEKVGVIKRLYIRFNRGAVALPCHYG
jgi:hypothetical protein